MLEVLVIFTVCLLAGFLTGLLSIGGGLIIIPMFLFVLPFFNIDFSLQQIVGISILCILLNSSFSLFYRRKEKFLHPKTLLSLVAFIILGSFSGGIISQFLHPILVLSMFLIISFISLYLINNEVKFEFKKSKFKIGVYLIFSLISIISSIVGIGGAILFISVLKCFKNVNPEMDMKELLPTSTVFVFVNALFAFVSKIIVGHVMLHLIPIILLASLIGAKIGVRVSKYMSLNLLQKLLSIILFLGIFKVIHEIFIQAF